MMKRSVLLVLLACALVMVTSCASTPEANPDGSPYWTTHVPTSGSKFYGVGYGKLSTKYNSQLKAEAGARDAISRAVSTQMKSMLTNFETEAQNRGLSAEALGAFETISVQVVNLSLRGVVIEETWLDPDGAMWALASFPTKNLKDAIKSEQEALQGMGEKPLTEAQMQQIQSMLQVWSDSVE